ncbi:MAG: septum site-determining protein MinC [Lachnospiraceae bacterium]|uniref:septum site-determining protein MinC n=1 Tax=Falcatimonas sp. MSJ-15 TaxID=2841515 RepID=UPI001C0FCC46|nr:septum site-determining protein MinC [Falcatimonas sp. MSJ-15]MBQ5734052.1 septum site-determining protein MinC [Lachnospiraceae bacterium]MBU5470831.1 septum site-determining protein MinC [Falcatimonas sp. MSJ-15]MEE0958707.1 septum site-determining protein MinC [Lachnospiraceae bacterium]
MDNSVMIKGDKYGIVLVMDKDMPFSDLLEKIAEKFSSAAKFYGNATMAISFKGRKLTVEEEKQILDTIESNTKLNIICVVDTDEERQEMFKKAVEAKLMAQSTGTGQFHKGTLRSGQVLESESSIIILGDVNPGAKVIAKGNVIVLGSLKGTIYAGINGNENAFVVALYMNPVQIRIGDTIARSPDDAISKKNMDMEPKIAFVESGNIYIEKLDKDVLNDIQL